MLLKPEVKSQIMYCVPIFLFVFLLSRSDTNGFRVKSDILKLDTESKQERKEDWIYRAIKGPLRFKVTGDGNYFVNQKIAELRLQLIFENERQTTTEAPWWLPTLAPATTKRPKTATTGHWWLPNAKPPTSTGPTILAATKTTAFTRSTQPATSTGPTTPAATKTTAFTRSTQPVTSTGPTIAVTGTPVTTVPLETTQSSGAFSPFELDGLNAHNKFRKTHNAPPMVLKRTMCDEAKRYATKIASTGALIHSSNLNGQGENLSMACVSGGGGQGSAQNASQATTEWYKEVCRPGYDFRFPNNQQQGTGHFTQVVWKGSTELGIGKADVHQNGGRCTYIVARYKPAGNFVGKFGQHVAMGSFKRSIYCQKVTGNKPAGFADNRDEYIL